jgi:hypothetical protein
MAESRVRRPVPRPAGTDQGHERTLAALRRSGFGTQAEEIAIRALGEDQADCRKLMETLWEGWNHADGLPRYVRKKRG